MEIQWIVQINQIHILIYENEFIHMILLWIVASKTYLANYIKNDSDLE